MTAKPPTLILRRKLFDERQRKAAKDWPKYGIAAAWLFSHGDDGQPSVDCGIGKLIETLYANGTLSKADVMKLIGHGWEEWTP